MPLAPTESLVHLARLEPREALAHKDFRVFKEFKV